MNEKLRHLDLFSGIGGFALGLESTGGFETVGFCDNEPFAQKVLKKHWPDVPCYEDIRDVGRDTDGLGAVDIITGGFPCQPISLAGQQKATEDDRWLWDEMFRVIKKFKSEWIIAENVRNLIEIREGVVFEQVCTDLESEGYQVQTFVLPASAVNAPHQRYRCWIVAHANNTRDRTSRSRTDENWEKEVKGWEKQPQSEPSRYSEDVANSDNARWEKQWWQESAQEEQQTSQCGSWWSVEPSVGRVAHGIPNRVDRLKGLGNAVVPQIPAVLGRAILEVHNG